MEPWKPVPCCWCPGCRQMIDLEENVFACQLVNDYGSPSGPVKYVFVQHTEKDHPDFECPFSGFPPEWEDFDPDWWDEMLRGKGDAEYGLYVFWPRPKEDSQ
jgi:hypothetical protein